MHKIFLVSALSLFLATNNAQAIAVGDACTDNGLSANTRDGTRNITLICDGANWVETISLNTAGNKEVRIIGDGGVENPPLTVQSDSLSMIDIIGYGLEEFDTHGAAIRFHGAAGTAASPLATPVGSRIGQITFRPHDGTDFLSSSANINARTTENVTSSAKGTKLEFGTTETGTNINATRMTIADNGNVGIGTAEPNAKLDVAGSTRIVADGGANPPLTVQSDSLASFNISSYGSEENSANYGSTIRLNSAGGTATSPIATQTGDLIGRISFRPHDGTDFLAASVAIEGYASEDVTSLAKGSMLRFTTTEIGSNNHTERMRINHNGNIGIGGLPNPTNPIEHANGAYLSAGGVWTNASSRDLKTNIQPIALETAVETVKALKPVSFYYKEETDDMKAGFIAEDVPDFVASPDRKSLASMDIVSVLTKVVKNQMETIELLQKETTQLRNDLTQLQEKVNNQ